MADIEIYTKEWCPYCARAKVLLRSKGLEYREIDVTAGGEAHLRPPGPRRLREGC
ncbi:MAG: hypothetical protein KKA32_12005 [Actinobacteria bacterium]|nr:hypothetical protein [Actinomycetota bacterium]